MGPRAFMMGGLVPPAPARSTTPAAAGLTLDQAMSRLQQGGGFMSTLLSRLRMQQNAATAPAATLGGTARTVSQVLGGRTGFFGGAGY